MANNTPSVTVISPLTNGGTPVTMSATTPGQIAQELGLSLSDVAISVNSSEANPSTPLSDGQYVSFQKNKVMSGNK
jgi:hypothetical protein